MFGLQSTSSTLALTPSGVLRGESTGEVRIFRGVPFAEPPVGALRFQPPAKLKPWTGQRDATQFSASPMQAGEPGVVHSEDCLYLNIWAPEGSGPFPVFIWIHGGGFTDGHAFDPLYDGTGFAQSGIVCISVAYRLGVFGFLDLEPLLGAQYAGSANNAMRDLIAALAWVQENIAAFGGDPARVTVGGQSAGAKLTDMLMGTPAAHPLFHQMISESGGAERLWPLVSSGFISEGFAKVWRGYQADLRTVAPNLLIDAQQAFIGGWPQHFPLRPEVDGVLLPRLPIDTIRTGSTRGKRLLIGTNRDESVAFIGPHPLADAQPAELASLELREFLSIYHRYRSVYPHFTDQQLRIRALTAEEYWIPSIRAVDAHLKGGGQAWTYLLDFVEAGGSYAGYAYHSLDLGLVWDKPNTGVGNDQAEAALASQVHAAWVAFIHGGAPAATGLPAWTRYDSDLRPTMILNTQSRVQSQPQAAELHLWEGVL